MIVNTSKLLYLQAKHAVSDIEKQGGKYEDLVEAIHQELLACGRKHELYGNRSQILMVQLTAQIEQ